MWPATLSHYTPCPLPLVLLFSKWLSFLSCQMCPCVYVVIYDYSIFCVVVMAEREQTGSHFKLLWWGYKVKVCTYKPDRQKRHQHQTLQTKPAAEEEDLFLVSCNNHIISLSSFYPFRVINFWTWNMRCILREMKYLF